MFSEFPQVFQLVRRMNPRNERLRLVRPVTSAAKQVNAAERSCSSDVKLSETSEAHEKHTAEKRSLVRVSIDPRNASNDSNESSGDEDKLQHEVKLVEKTSTINSKTKTISIEGNIGAGKSTLLSYLRNRPNIQILPEPVEEWRNLNGYNLLELVYKDQSRYGLLFQSFVMLTMLKNHLKRSPQPFRILERSLQSSQECFVRALQTDVSIHQSVFEVLKAWNSFIYRTFAIDLDFVIYLRTTPEKIYERVTKRGRKEENCISLSYLRKLHLLHEEWIDRMLVKSRTNVVILNGNKSISELKNDFLKVIDKIEGIFFSENMNSLKFKGK